MTGSDSRPAFFNVLRAVPRVGPPDLDPGLLSTQFPPAAALLAQPETEGVLLVRYARDGSFAGDTWHADWDEVREEAEDEFGDALGEWHAIPAGTEDLEAYVRSRL